MPKEAVLCKLVHASPNLTLKHMLHCGEAVSRRLPRLCSNTGSDTMCTGVVGNNERQFRIFTSCESIVGHGLKGNSKQCVMICIALGQKRGGHGIPLWIFTNGGCEIAHQWVVDAEDRLRPVACECRVGFQECCAPGF